MDLSSLDHVIAAVAAFAAGIVNAVAGGGTLITFPTLVALGVTTVGSNITNTVALCPGYFGGTYAQRADLAEQRARLVPVGVTAAIGGLCGSALLVASSEKLFRTIVPFLLVAACLLLAAGDRIKASLPVRDPDAPVTRPPLGVLAAVFGGSVYGGYFGAGLGIILLAVLGLALPDRMVRINGIKQYIAFVTNVVAALFFVGSGKVVWSLVLVMAPASLLGGNLGGRLVRTLDPRILRAVVIVLGLVVAIRFWTS